MMKSAERQMSISIIIPMLNAEAYIERLIRALLEQTVVPDEIIVVDSESEDNTAKIAAGLPRVHLMPIRRKEFDHGGTRDMALRASCGEFVLFMTQDALPVDAHYIEHLVAPFADERVAAVGGRQVAYPDARPFEKAVRRYNYSAEERVWNAEDIERLGVRAFLISDVCAAYRRSAYLETGGFDHPILTNEDMLMAERLLHAGYKLAYCGRAAVYHSHRFTLRQDYQRNLIVGRTMKRYERRFEYVKETGEGIGLARAVLMQLIREGELVECVCFAASCAARLLGNRVGRYLEGKEHG